MAHVDAHGRASPRSIPMGRGLLRVGWGLPLLPLPLGPEGWVHGLGTVARMRALLTPPADRHRGHWGRGGPGVRCGAGSHRPPGRHDSPQPSLASASSVFVFVIPLFFNCDFSGGERCWIDKSWRRKGLWTPLKFTFTKDTENK